MTWVVTAAVVAVAATGASVYQQNKSAKAQRQQQQVQNKIDERARKREQLAQLRQAQIARAQATQASVNTGTSDSSGLAGQIAGINATALGNVAFSQQVQTGAEQVAMFGNKAAGAATVAGNWAAVAQISNMALSSIPNKPKTDPNKPAG